MSDVILKEHPSGSAVLRVICRGKAGKQRGQSGGGGSSPGRGCGGSEWVEQCWKGEPGSGYTF